MKHDTQGTNPSPIHGVNWARLGRRFGPPVLGLAVACGVLASMPSARHAEAVNVAPIAPSSAATVKTADAMSSCAHEDAGALAMAGRCIVTCSTNVTQSNDENQCGAVVSYPPPTTQGDDCTTITCTPPSGSFFPVGTTTVTCADAGGSSCTFEVTVADTQPPLITCPPNQFAVTASPGAASVVVAFPLTASDNCPGVTLACTPPSGSAFPLGLTTVTCTATDASGNTATCSFTVTVFDVCVQDDSNAAKVLKWNSTTGDYLFCCNGTVYSGKGTATKQGNIYNLVHNPIGRRVLGRVDNTQKRGTGSIQSPPGQIQCTIMDRDTRNNTCVCP